MMQAWGWCNVVIHAAGKVVTRNEILAMKRHHRLLLGQLTSQSSNLTETEHFPNDFMK